MALVTSKYIELQTNTSIKKFIHEGKKITDARLKNKITSQELKIRAKLTPEIIKILSQLNLLT
jgi:hypothetical protein